MFLSRSLVPVAALLPFLYTKASAQTACNNSPSLCNKAYNNITQLGTHNSPFLRDSSTSFSTSGNQYYNTTVQLEAGVRALSAQVHKTDASGTEAWHLCHSSCELLDAGSLTSWLTEIKTWMDANPHDVVTLILVNSDDASASDLDAQFRSAGIDKYAYTPPSSTNTTPSSSWPTLNTLITNNTRLITFVASLPQASSSSSSSSSSAPYILDEFTFLFENPYDTTTPTNFSCNPSRPASLATPTAARASHHLFLMNHFLYETQALGIQTPNASYAHVTNAQTGEGSLGQRIAACTAVYDDAPPSIVLVDFFNVGPAMAVVDGVNGVGGATVGRKEVGTAALGEKSWGVGGKAGGRRAGWVAVAVAFAVAAGTEALPMGGFLLFFQREMDVKKWA